MSRAPSPGGSSFFPLRSTLSSKAAGAFSPRGCEPPGGPPQAAPCTLGLFFGVKSRGLLRVSCFSHGFPPGSPCPPPTGASPAPAAGSFRSALGPNGFDTIIEIWLPLAWSLNMVNRSMGKPDLYPFVLSVPVLEKMRLIHGVLEGWPTVGW